MAKRRPRSVRPHTQVQAHQLRRQITPAEQKLWKRLRAKQLVGLKFRRQQPLGRFIVDFFCPAARLVIEIDGDSHADRERIDASRTRWLETEGFHVLRFVNSDVHHRIDLVMEKIAEECRRAVATEQS